VAVGFVYGHARLMRLTLKGGSIITASVRPLGEGGAYAALLPTSDGPNTLPDITAVNAYDATGAPVAELH
jgi:hypothetical protein